MRRAVSACRFLFALVRKLCCSITAALLSTPRYVIYSQHAYLTSCACWLCSDLIHEEEVCECELEERDASCLQRCQSCHLLSGQRRQQPHTKKDGVVVRMAPPQPGEKAPRSCLLHTETTGKECNIRVAFEVPACLCFDQKKRSDLSVPKDRWTSRSRVGRVVVSRWARMFRRVARVCPTSA